MAGVIQFGVLGLGLAAIYALLAQGVVLIYRGSGVVNFAQGAFALGGAILFTELHDGGASVVISVLAAIVGMALVGAAMQNLIMARLRGAAPIVRVIATLAVFIGAVAGAGLHYGDNVIIVPQYLPAHQWSIGTIVFQSDRIILFGIAAAVTVALALVQKRWLIGLATRGAAENELSVSLLGWSPNMLATVNWTIGGALAGAAGALIVPLTGLLVNNVALLIVPALAAALLGGFDSFWRTLLGAFGIGVSQAIIERYWQQPGAPDAVPFLVIIVVLVLSGKSLPLRSHIAERLPAIGKGIIRPVPALVGSAVLLVCMAVVFNTTWQDAFTVSLMEAILLLSIVVVTGYAGQVSLGQFALAGLGAFVAGRLISSQGWPFWAASIAGIAASVPIGLAFALPALRTRGVNLAVVTLGLGVALNALLFSNVAYTGGLNGTSVGNASLFGYDVDAISHPDRYGIFVSIFFIVAAIAVANLRRSMSGRRLIAIRENERAAASLGISVTAAKLYAFTVGSVLASLAGILIAFRSTSVVYSNFDPFSSIFAVAYAVIGGVGYVFGPLFGSLLAAGGIGSLLSGLLNGIENYLALIGSGVLIVVLIADPNGLVSLNLAAARAELNSKAAYLRPEVLLILVARRLFMPIAARVVPAGRSARHAGRAERQRQAMLASTSLERVAPRRLDVSGLTVRFGSVLAVNDVSLVVEPGEVVGLIGPNGAGKTTLIDAVTGFVRPAAGTIRVGDRMLGRLPAFRRAQYGIARSWQSLEIFEDISVLENLQIASESRIDGRIQGVRSLIWPKKPPLTAVARAAIAEFELASDLDRSPSDLSYGRRRLLGIARAVALNPSVLLLDEPAAGLSGAESRELGALIRRLAESWGISVLLIEHDVELVMTVCDRIVVLDFGNKIAEGTPEEIRVNPAVARAYLGTDVGEDGASADALDAGGRASQDDATPAR